MQKFKAEWASEYGPEYRGVELEHGDRNIRWSMSDELHRSDVKETKSI